MPTADPRVYFAAERTLLAWVRTALTVMGFGFVVARFGLFLRIMAAQHPSSPPTRIEPSFLSTLVGVALVLLGSIILFVAARQHRAFIRTLPPIDVPSTHQSFLPLAVAIALGVLGLALAIYLLT